MIFINSVVHFEIEADDINRAQQFYQEIFGWKIVRVPDPKMEYYIAYTTEVDDKYMPKTPGAINGGLQKRSSHGAGTVLVINVPDLNATLTQIQAQGGKIIMPQTQVADMGLYARVTDSEGNLIGVWQDLKPPVA